MPRMLRRIFANLMEFLDEAWFRICDFKSTVVIAVLTYLSCKLSGISREVFNDRLKSGYYTKRKALRDKQKR